MVVRIHQSHSHNVLQPTKQTQGQTPVDFKSLLGSLAAEAWCLIQALHDTSTISMNIVIGTVSMLIFAMNVISTGIIMQLLVRSRGFRNMLL